MSQPCTCGLPAKWASDPAFPVGFDGRMNEYYITQGPSGTGRARMRFCFWCGGRLPESRRASFFVEMDRQEVEELQGLLAGVRDVEGVRRALGEPDAVHAWADDGYSRQHAAIYGVEEWKTQYDFGSRWRTLDVTVHEKADGSISYSYSGKSKGATGA